MRNAHVMHVHVCMPECGVPFWLLLELYHLNLHQLSEHLYLLLHQHLKEKFLLFSSGVLSGRKRFLSELFCTLTSMNVGPSKFSILI